ncbi:MAG: nucleotide-binding protein [Candidatus Nanoarchaeia archaeon]|nr:nucleotide-binding protein [Candidatus Nanoarchaeia archaeon]
MKLVLLDTNFMLIPFEFRVDIFAELNRIMPEKTSLFTLSVCIDELKVISARHYKAVLEILRKNSVRIMKVEKEKPVDDIIVDTADKEKAIVATQDIALRRKCREKGIKCISMRTKNHLEFV